MKVLLVFLKKYLATSMDFQSAENLKIIICESCHGNGLLAWVKCSKCHGFGAGVVSEGRFFYFGRSLSSYFITARNAGRIFQTLVNFLLGLLVFIFGALFVLGLIGQIWPNLFVSIFGLKYTGLLKDMWTPRFLWWSVFIMLFITYRNLKNKIITKRVDKTFIKDNSWPTEEVSWNTIFTFKKTNKEDISLTLSTSAVSVIENSIKHAAKRGAKEVSSLDLFLALLSFPLVANVFGRFGVSVKDFKNTLISLEEKNKKSSDPDLGAQFWQIIFQAYREAGINKLHHVDITELLVAVVGQDIKIQDLLVELGINGERLGYVVTWVRLQEEIVKRWLKFSKRAGLRPKGETNRAMTALATPFLDQYSRDLTFLAARGALEICVGREKELEEVFRVFTSGARGLILIGPAGVGKRTILEGVAEAMINEDVPEILSDKRLVELHLPALLSGVDASLAGQRLLNCLWEIERSGNIILVIPSIEQLVGIAMGGKQSMDLADVLVKEMERRNLLVIATASPDAYHQVVSGTPLVNVLQKVNIEESNFGEAVKILESKTRNLEFQNQIFFSYSSLAKAVELATKFLPDTYLPASALELLGEAAVMVHTKRGKNYLVEGEDVAQIVSSKVNVPLTAVTEEESSKLVRLEEVMHGRVIGQDEAITLVASAMRRARAGVRNTKRPVASFLFLGPTGVGKTETAKTLAEVYFGREDMMIRLDMSEYQDKNSIYRLIGATGVRGSGILTEAVKQAPASLVLLDELEKADPDILNLFLQVLDDGRLTDSVGQVIDFTNTIIIATSNAGTSFVQEQVKAGVSMEKIRELFIHGELMKYYRPEFINRFDAVVMFKSLTLEEVKQIAGVIFKGLAKKLKEEKEIYLEASQAAIDNWANLGYDPQFGARPLRRVMQEKIEDKIADLVLGGKVKRNQAIIFDVDKIDVVDKKR